MLSLSGIDKKLARDVRVRLMRDKILVMDPAHGWGNSTISHTAGPEKDSPKDRFFVDGGRESLANSNIIERCLGGVEREGAEPKT